MKPESYPFMRIARQFAVEYADVLAYAQTFQPTASFGFIYSTEDRLSNIWNGDLYWRIADEVGVARRRFHDIQAGRIDWLTGETREADNG